MQCLLFMLESATIKLLPLKIIVRFLKCTMINDLFIFLLQALQFLESPLLNKGTAFSEEERQAFNLNGLLPQTIENIEEQVARAYEQFSSCETDLKIYLPAQYTRYERNHVLSFGARSYFRNDAYHLHPNRWPCLRRILQ